MWFTVINDTIKAFVVNSTLEIYYSLCFLPGYKSCPFLPSQATLCDISIRQGIWCLTKLQWDKWMAEFWISCDLKMSDNNLCSFMAKKSETATQILGCAAGCGLRLCCRGNAVSSVGSTRKAGRIARIDCPITRSLVASCSRRGAWKTQWLQIAEIQIESLFSICMRCLWVTRVFSNISSLMSAAKTLLHLWSAESLK